MEGPETQLNPFMTTKEQKGTVSQTSRTHFGPYKLFRCEIVFRAEKCLGDLRNIPLVVGNFSKIFERALL